MNAKVQFAPALFVSKSGLPLLFHLDMAQRGRRKTITNFLEIADVVLLRDWSSKIIDC